MKCQKKKRGAKSEMSGGKSEERLSNRTNPYGVKCRKQQLTVDGEMVTFESELLLDKMAKIKLLSQYLDKIRYKEKFETCRRILKRGEKTMHHIKGLNWWFRDRKFAKMGSIFFQILLQNFCSKRTPLLE